MKKFLGYILSPFATIAFFLALLIFHPIQWVCFRLFGYKAHKRAVDLLNLCLLSTAYIVGNSVTFINKQNLPTDRPIIFWLTIKACLIYHLLFGICVSITLNLFQRLSSPRAFHLYHII